MCLVLDNESLNNASPLHDTPPYLGSHKKGKVSEKSIRIKGKIQDSQPLSLLFASEFKPAPPPPTQVLPSRFPQRHPQPLLYCFYCSNLSFAAVPYSPLAVAASYHCRALKILLNPWIKTNLMDGAVRYKIERKDVNSPKITSILSTSLVAGPPTSTLNLASGSFSGSNSWQFLLTLALGHSATGWLNRVLNLT